MKHQTGFALFEILLTLSISGFCILSLMQLQLITLQLAYDNYHRFITHVAAMNLYERHDTKK